MHNLFMKQFTPKVPSAIMGIYNSFLDPHKQGYIDTQHEVVYLRTETEGQAKRTWTRTYTAQHPLQMIWLFICEAQERKQLCIPWSPKHRSVPFHRANPAHSQPILSPIFCRASAGLKPPAPRSQRWGRWPRADTDLSRGVCRYAKEPWPPLGWGGVETAPVSPIGTHPASQVAEPTDSGEGREPDRLVLGTARSLSPEKAHLCTQERGEDVDQGDEATPSSTAGLAKEGLASRRRRDNRG